MRSVHVGVWCDVPSAGGLATLGPADVAELAIAWAKEGRDLFVLSSSETPLMNELIPSGIVGDTTSLEPLYPTAIEPTITSRPDEIVVRSEEHTSELQSLMRISYAVFCLKKKNKNKNLHQLLDKIRTQH